MEILPKKPSSLNRRRMVTLAAVLATVSALSAPGLALAQAKPKVAGIYTVQWKNLSVDGHSEKGTYSFTLNLDRTQRPLSTPESLKSKGSQSCSATTTRTAKFRNSAPLRQAIGFH